MLTCCQVLPASLSPYLLQSKAPLDSPAQGLAALPPAVLSYLIQPFGLLYPFIIFVPFNLLPRSWSPGSPLSPPMVGLRVVLFTLDSGYAIPHIIIDHTYERSCPSFFISLFHSEGNTVVDSDNSVAQDELDVGR